MWLFRRENNYEKVICRESIEGRNMKEILTFEEKATKLDTEKVGALLQELYRCVDHKTKKKKATREPFLRVFFRALKASFRAFKEEMQGISVFTLVQVFEDEYEARKKR